MTQSPDNLIWIDLEMTGLDTDKDYIIEIATVITGSQLNIVAEGPALGGSLQGVDVGSEGEAGHTRFTI